ncbi:MAG: prephenate dehydrogenase [Treponemataceae bacterium]|nr:MAG: prephenate dehydrogenase [Treponemataceae bacterium]
MDCATQKFKTMTFGIAGLGLMGGSFAKALKKNVFPQKIIGFDTNHDSIEKAKTEGIIDAGFASDRTDALSECDFVFVCLYPAASIEFLKTHREKFKRGGIVTDISGVKAALSRELSAIVNTGEAGDNRFDFISGHPMAGSEKEGYRHADAAIFAGRNYILMPTAHNKAENIALFKSLITALGFARIIETDFSTHDHKIAFTSQLCHIIAASLVDSAEDTKITAFGGGSFEDLTRIAMINAPLWTELFLANKDELIGHIESFEAALREIKQLLTDEKKTHLAQKLESIRTKRISMV